MNTTREALDQANSLHGATWIASFYTAESRSFALYAEVPADNEAGVKGVGSLVFLEIERVCAPTWMRGPVRFRHPGELPLSPAKGTMRINISCGSEEHFILCREVKFHPLKEVTYCERKEA